MREYGADILAGCETQADWRFLSDKQKFENLFGQAQEKRHVAADNTTEKVKRDQTGGTAMMTFGRLSGLVLDTGADETDLGRWCWIKLG